MGKFEGTHIKIDGAKERVYNTLLQGKNPSNLKNHRSDITHETVRNDQTYNLM